MWNGPLSLSVNLSYLIPRLRHLPAYEVCMREKGPAQRGASSPKLPLPELPHRLARLQPLYPKTDPSIFSVPNLLTAPECQQLLGQLLRAHPLEHVAHAQTSSIAWRDVER